MKTLKVKSILFSLLAIMAVAFMTSCEQEEMLTPDIGIEETILDDDISERDDFSFD